MLIDKWLRGLRGKMKVESRKIAPGVVVLSMLLVIVVGVAVWALETRLRSTMEADLREQLYRYYTEPAMRSGNFAGDWHDLPENEQAWFPHLGAFAPPDDFESVSIERSEEGTVGFNNRRIPAIIATVQIVSVNREAGTRTSGCMLVMEAKDDDFQVYRAINVTNCDGSADSRGDSGGAPPIDVNEKIWKAQNDFQSG